MRGGLRLATVLIIVRGSLFCVAVGLKEHSSSETDTSNKLVLQNRGSARSCFSHSFALAQEREPLRGISRNVITDPNSPFTPAPVSRCSCGGGLENDAV
jgi:hypothetical protein